MEKHLYRSQANRVILGVCGGMAEYFNVDPVIMRVVAVLVIIATSILPGLLAYFVLGLIVPLKGTASIEPKDHIRENVEDIRNTTSKLGEEIRSAFSSSRGTSEGANPPTSGTPAHPQPTNSTTRSSGLLIIGILIIAIGVVFLLWNVLSWFFHYLWPAVLILAGVLIVVAVISKKS
jgi:phage shock protein C